MLRLPDLDGSRAPCARACQVLLAVVFLSGSLCALPAAEDEAGKKKAEAKPKVTLSPEKEAKLAEVLKKAGEAKRKFWSVRMKKEIERVVKVTGLDAAGTKALDALAEEAMNACLGGWITTFGESWRKYLGEQSEVTVEMEEIVAQLDQTAQMDWYGEYVRPIEHPKWEEGLRQTLGAERMAVWEKAQKERNEAIEKEAAGVVKAMVDQTCDQQRNGLLAKATAIKSALDLPKERAEKLDALAGTASATVADALEKRARKMLLAVDDEQRQQMLKVRQVYFGLEEKDLELQETAWKEGLSKLLSAEEVSRLEVAREGFVARRVVVMGQILLTQLDEKVAFTTRQREQLRPLAERLVKGQPSLFPDLTQERFYRIDPLLIYGAGAKATEAELQPILDARQCKHWQEACLAKNLQPGRVSIVRRKAEATVGPKQPTAAPEPEDLENAFSDYFHERTVNERKRLLGINLLKAEDAGRIAGLSPAALARLETAARGASEEALTAWKPGVESSIRSQVRDATPENVKQRLAGMENYSYRTSVAAVSTIGDGDEVSVEVTAISQDDAERIGIGRGRERSIDAAQGGPAQDQRIFKERRLPAHFSRGGFGKFSVNGFAIAPAESGSIRRSVGALKNSVHG